MAVNRVAGLVMCLVIILVAIAGKLGGSMLMARWTHGMLVAVVCDWHVDEYERIS